MKKKVLSILMALIMVAGLAVVPSGQSIKADAAAKKGAVVPVSFNDNVDWDSIDWGNNTMEICIWGPEGVTLSADLKLSATLYVPKYLFNKKGDEHVLNTTFNMNLMEEESWDYIGSLHSTWGFELTLNKDGEMSLGVGSFDDTPVDTSWASIDEKGDYYVLTIDGYPLGGTVNTWDEEKEEDGFIPLDLNKKYNINVSINVTPMNGVGGDAVIILDDLVVKDSANELMSADFEGDTVFGDKWTKGDDQEKRPEIKNTSYTTSLLSLKSNKADIVVGKKAKIKATTVAGTKVTYKSNKPKIASVDAKGNVKGLKKGKAVISVTCCGKTLKYTVKVADKKKK